MKRSKDDIIFDAINTLILSAVLLIVLYPLYYVVLASISDPYLAATGSIGCPICPTMSGNP